MTDDQKMTTIPVEPIVLTMVGTGQERPPLPQSTIAVTPDHLPNVVVNIIGPAFALLIRFVNFYLTTLVGLLPAALTPKGGQVMAAIGAHDFAEVLLACASIALAPAALDFLKNLITIFGRLEKKYPILTGSV